MVYFSQFDFAFIILIIKQYLKTFADFQRSGLCFGVNGVKELWSVAQCPSDVWCPSEVCPGTSAKGLSALSTSLPMTSNCGITTTAAG